jgi:phosphoenolpyruvate-protein phosphotransferase
VTRIALSSPLAGWVRPLSEVCDEVFASGLAGDGVAIDPVGDTLHAPCDGEIVPVGRARHALTLRHASGVELLMHVGIDTVALQGAGFETLVEAGQQVRRGDPLLRFDLDRIARDARSAVTPILIAGGARVLTRVEARAVQVGDALLEIEADVAATVRRAGGAEETRRRFRVPFDHGLHARPAAQLVAALRGSGASVTLHARGRQADARSTVALMALGVQRGDEVEAVVRGADAEAALAALAQILSGVPETVPAVAPAAPSASTQVPGELAAVIAARGLSLGRAVGLHEPEIEVEAAGRGVALELDALRQARTRVAAHLAGLRASSAATQREVLDAHQALLDDPQLLHDAEREVQGGRSAGFAWRSAIRVTSAALESLGDSRMAERAADLRDLERQVLRVLAGAAPAVTRELPEDAIVLADELLPSQLAALDPARVLGICMARGGPTSHVALLAAARGIPTLVGAGPALLAVSDGTPLLVDAERGRIAIDPAPAEAAAMRERIAQRAAREAADLSAAARMAVLRDGSPVAVLANIGAVAEVCPAVARGAEGCGLLRTEFLFLERRTPPDEDEQARVYAAVIEGFGTRPVTIRTLDVGGDKPLAYLPLPHEENPVLGLRGLRVGLREPALLRTQLRAVLQAGRRGRARLMLPMVNDLSELRVVRAMLRDCAHELGDVPLPALGVMVETPAAALLADQLAREADFLSIGSNDLSQYVLAMDRGHPELGARLDGLHPAVLRLIGQVADAAQRAGRSASVCGGMASDLEAVPLLIGLGIRELSAVPSAIPRIKRALRELDPAACEALARRALECADAAEVRALVREPGSNARPRLHAAG